MVRNKNVSFAQAMALTVPSDRVEEKWSLFSLRWFVSNKIYHNAQ